MPVEAVEVPSHPVMIEREEGDDDAWGGDDDVDMAEEGCFVEFYPNAAKIIGRGRNLFERVMDEMGDHREELPYYPFSCLKDFEMAAWLTHTQLSLASESLFYSTGYVS